MGYVGRGLNQDGGQYRKLDSIATSFNGSETNFTLTIDGLEVTPTAQNLMISLGGVIQEPGTAFTVNGSTITFASAPADATTFFGVLMGEATFIARGTVGAAEMGITAGAVSASAGVVVDSSKNVIGFNEISASIFKGSFSGDTSSSINTRINSLVTDSGSFSTRITNATASINSISSSQATRTANLVIASSSLSASVATLKGSGTLQSVATNASPTFAGATITGTLTAQEVHTEFESASILFTSGSTQFGNSSDDVHDFKGNTISGSATSTGSFGSAHFRGVGGVGIGTNNPGNVLHLEFNDDSDVFTADRITDNSVSGILINNLDTGNGHGGMLKFANKNGDNHTAIAHSQDGNTDASLLFYTMDGGTLAEVMRVDHTHRVGIGDGAPGSPLDVKSSEAANTANFNSTNGATNITFESDGSLIGQMEFSSAGPTQIVTRTTASLALGVNNNQYWTIKNDGTLNSSNSALHITTNGTDDGDYNGAVLSRGVLNLNRDDTATVKQIKFHKNGSEHSSIETTSDGLNISGSEVGIGTRVPLATLHVEHTTDDTDENGNIALTVGGGASGAVRHYWGINNSSNYAYYGAVEHATQYVPLVLQPNGSLVSIGSPTHNTRVGQQLAVTAGGGSNRGGIAINTYLADTQSPLIDFNRSRSNTVGSHAGLSSGDGIGGIIWRGSDGDEFVDAAAISAEVDGSTGNNDVPGRILFYTTPDGTNSLVERMRINNAGHVAIGGDVVNRGSMNKALEVHAGSDGEISITATDELSDDQRIGQFAFYTDKSYYNMACIVGRVSGTDENRGEMSFHTRGSESGGTPSERWRIDTDGHFMPGINNTYDIGSNSTRVRTFYAVNALNTSDRTLKKNINDCDLGLTFVNTLKPKSFYFNDTVSGSIEHDRKNYGLIAQDLMDTPLSDSVFGEKDGEYNLRYNDLFAPMIKAIQDLSKQVETLKAQVSGSN